MPQALVCKRCNEPFVFTGNGIELVGESRIGCRHRCGAMNELQFVRTDESGRAVYRVVGVVSTVHDRLATATQKGSGASAAVTAPL
jgi:hypothetical protein